MKSIWIVDSMRDGHETVFVSWCGMVYTLRSACGRDRQSRSDLFVECMCHAWNICKYCLKLCLHAISVLQQLSNFHPIWITCTHTTLLHCKRVPHLITSQNHNQQSKQQPVDTIGPCKPMESCHRSKHTSFSWMHSKTTQLSLKTHLHSFTRTVIPFSHQFYAIINRSVHGFTLAPHSLAQVSSSNLICSTQSRGGGIFDETRVNITLKCRKRYPQSQCPSNTPKVNDHNSRPITSILSSPRHT